MSKWMIYGATGYSGELIAQEAVNQGLSPVIAGRTESKLRKLADELNVDFKVFTLDSSAEAAEQLKEFTLVLNCAGPFTMTAKAMLEACMQSQTHYLDITGEISVFEMAKKMNAQASDEGIIVCPGVGFDVIPTDCVAAKLKQILPDATRLSLGFDSRSGFSPGTAKTAVEGLAQGGKIRKNGHLLSVPLAYKIRTINFGDGEKKAMTIPWGDISTAYSTTGIENIEVYVPAHPKLISRLKKLNMIRGLLKFEFVQSWLKKQIEKRIKGPDQQTRNQQKTYVWGEVRNQQGQLKTLRIETASGYDLTITGSLEMVKHVLENNQMKSGYLTPSQLVGAEFVTLLPGSKDFIYD